MNLDDETLLTAYLDGELDPQQRLGVERALSTDARLAERLRGLAAVRDLVSNLPRPTIPLSLAGSILERGRVPSASRRLGPRWALPAMSAALSAAATLFVAFTLGLFSDQGPGRPQIPANRPAIVATRPRTEAEKEAVGVADQPYPPAVVTPRLEAAVPRAMLASRDASREANRRKVSEMLDSADLRRVFVVTDVVGGDAPERVDALVQRLPRADAAYGRFTISQGIFIDPRHPNEATVFAVVMDDRELKEFQNKFAGEFPEAVEERPTEALNVAKLAAIGQVSILSGTQVADVTIPTELPVQVARREATAPGALNRSRFGGGLGPLSRAVDADSGEENPALNREQPTPAQELSAPREASLARSPEPPEKPHEGLSKVAERELIPVPEPRHRTIVLVWVTSGDRAATRKH